MEKKIIELRKNQDSVSKQILILRDKIAILKFDSSISNDEYIYHLDVLNSLYNSFFELERAIDQIQEAKKND